MTDLSLPRRVDLVEVGLRDGLQNEDVIVATDRKIALIEGLVQAGITRIEAVSFVHPRLVPTMADAEAVMAAVPRSDDVSYAALVLNRRGLDRALAAEVDEVNFVVCVSDEFSRRNQNMSRDKSLALTIELVAVAREHSLFTTVTLATAFGCPFQGVVPPEDVEAFAATVFGAGVDEICLADTIGVGVPSQVTDLAARVHRASTNPGLPLRFHFHNTRNTGYANAYAALLAGTTVLDASVGGLGGCPFAPNATGNIATEDLMYQLDGLGVDHPGRLTDVLRVTADIPDLVEHPTESLVARAGPFPPSLGG